MTRIGRLFIVGLGPGERAVMTGQALEALRCSRVIVGYSGYFEWIADLVDGKECLALPLGEERERARLAVERALAGETVGVISSGDAGIYGMASLVLETLEAVEGDADLESVSTGRVVAATGGSPVVVAQEQAPGEPPVAPNRKRAQQTLEVAVVPGVSAVNACAALLGAPLGHDFAVVSLSDLLTPWQLIEQRLAAAAKADFVLALLNPQSPRRDWQFRRAQEILLQSRRPETPVGIVRQAYRPGQSVEITTLARMTEAAVDMFATVIVGNSQTRRSGDNLVTPRGYPRSAIGSPPADRGQQIVEESFRIIEREVGAHVFAAEEWPVVRRLIHASGDLEMVRLACFRRDAVSAGVQALRQGTPIVTDVRMVAAGLNKTALEKLHIAVHCFMDDPEAARRAIEEERTRSACAMEKAIAMMKRAIYVVGNAPTALVVLCEAIRRGDLQPSLVVAAPVGFVAVNESKEQAFSLDVPLIGVRGRKGGSAIAAAAVNALLLMATEETRR